jgi:hypothetical protein
LITVDKNMPHQQSLRDRQISLILLQSLSTDIAALVPLIPDVLLKLKLIRPGEVVRFGAP